MTLGDLFLPMPLRWGLRGDGPLWTAMRERFAGDPLPENEFVLLDAIAAAFEELTGVKLEKNVRHIPVEAFSKGSGMSDGIVSGDWWYDVGRMLLLDRWHVASSGGH